MNIQAERMNITRMIISLIPFLAIGLLLKFIFHTHKTALSFYMFGGYIAFMLSLVSVFFSWIGLSKWEVKYHKLLGIGEEQYMNAHVVWNRPLTRASIFWGLLFSHTLLMVGVIAVWKLLLKNKVISPNNLSTNATTTNSNSFLFRIKTGILSIDNIFRGVLVIGGAGSGKSKSIIEPLIQQGAEKGFSGIVYDYKFPTLAEEVNGSYNKQSGVKKYFINFKDLSTSHRVNPLHPILIENSSYAREYATTIIHNLDPQAIKQKDFWVQSAESLLTGAIWYLKQEYPNYCTLPHAVALLLTHDPANLIKALQQNTQVAGIIASAASSLGSAKQTAGLFSTIQNQLSVLYTPEIFWVLSGNDFSLNLNKADERKMLVIGNYPTLSSTFSPVISLIITAALKQMNQAGKAPSLIILDEAPTLYIPKFEEIPATGRSNQLATVFCAQDIAQMEDRYGAPKAEAILSNLGNQFFGRTTNPKTAERVSKLFGKKDQFFQSRGMSRSFDKSSRTHSEAVQQRDRVEAQEVMRLQAGVFCGLIAEGNQKDFYSAFEPQQSNAIALSAITKVSEQMLQEQFNRIVSDVQNILKGSGAATTSATEHSFVDY